MDTHQATQKPTQHTQLITLNEASELTRRSIITIRRRILSKHLKAKKVRGRFVMDKQTVIDHFNIGGTSPGGSGGEAQDPSPGGPGREAQGVPVNNVIEILTAQLSAKDKQIENLSERMRELNILLHQQKALPAAQQAQQAEVVKQPEVVKVEKKKWRMSLTDFLILVSLLIWAGLITVTVIGITNN